MLRRSVGPTATVLDWLERHPDGKKWDALLAWVSAVSIDADMVTTSVYVNPRNGRTIRAADIPTARTRAVFMVFNSPVLTVHILRLDDDLYAGL
jgi:hypothetical protein